MGTLESSSDSRKLIEACKKAGNVTPDGKCEWGGFYDLLPLHLVSHGDTTSVYDRNPGGNKIRFRTNLNDTMNQLKLVKYTTKKYSPDEKQAIVVEAMRDVCRFKYCQDVINLGNQGKNTMGYLEDALPFILHLHKIVMEKIIEILLVKPFHHVKKQSAAGRIWHANFVSKVLNTTAFGTAEEPGTYVLPVGSDGEMGEIKLNDKWAKYIEHFLDEILSLIITDQPDKLADWTSCVSKLSEMFKILGKRKYFTEPEIKDVQIKIDFGLKLWLGIVKREVVTNYIHMLGAGHIAHFLTKYKNLYWYSNQGWKFQNKQVSHNTKDFVTMCVIWQILLILSVLDCSLDPLCISSPYTHGRFVRRERWYMLKN
jgi:hypothetical protein